MAKPVLLWVDTLRPRNRWLSREPQEELLSASSQSLLELVQTTACIDKLLLAGEEGVALRANLDFDLFSLSGLSNNGLAACALDNALYVFGLDSFLHFSVPHKIISL